MTNRRNAFQQLMHRWSRLHPYNALHIAELSGPADAEALRQAANRTLAELGIGRLLMESDDRRFRFEPGPAEVPVEQLPPAAGEEEAALSAAADKQLNQPFPPSPLLPVRLFILPTERSHHVGLCYDHWIGDGFAMAYVLHRIIAAYLGLPASPTPAPTDLDMPEYGPVFGRFMDFFKIFNWTWNLIRELMRVRSCYGPRAGDHYDLSQHVSFHPLPADAATRLAAAARARGGTMHDLFLAALGESIAANTRERLRRSRRHDLALSSIIDLRTLAGPEFRSKAGLYLGYFNVFLRSCDAGDFETLFRRIASQTSHIKQTREYLRSLVDLWVGDNVFPIVWPQTDAKRYRKHMPIAGGVSNSRLPDWYAGGFKDRLLGYRRAVPTGPNTPLALAPTTVNGRLVLGVTARTSGFPPERIRTITAALLARLEGIR